MKKGDGKLLFTPLTVLELSKTPFISGSYDYSVMSRCLSKTKKSHCPTRNGTRERKRTKHPRTNLAHTRSPHFRHARNLRNDDDDGGRRRRRLRRTVRASGSGEQPRRNARGRRRATHARTHPRRPRRRSGKGGRNVSPVGEVDFADVRLKAAEKGETLFVVFVFEKMKTILV